MTLREVPIGIKLELSQIGWNGEMVGMPMLSRLESHEAEGGIVVLAPIREDSFPPYRAGDLFAVVFENSGERYGFRAQVRDRFLDGNLRFLFLFAETEITSVQRRDFYRLSQVMDCEWRPAPDSKNPNSKNALFQRVVTRNIGGGGIGLAFENEPEMGMNIECRLKAEIDIIFSGHVVRVSRLEGESRYKYEAGIAFKAISDIDREKLIRLIYGIQRNLLRRGWMGA